MRTSSSLSTCTVVSELLSIAPWPPARTESEATADRPPSLQSGRTAGEPADTGWKEPAGRRSAGRKYFGWKPTTETLKPSHPPVQADRPLLAPMCSWACWLFCNLREPGEWGVRLLCCYDWLVGSPPTHCNALHPCPPPVHLGSLQSISWCGSFSSGEKCQSPLVETHCYLILIDFTIRA